MYSDESERVYYTCKECCYGVSAPWESGLFWSKIDAHETETGHTMDEARD